MMIFLKDVDKHAKFRCLTISHVKLLSHISGEVKNNLHFIFTAARNRNREIFIIFYQFVKLHLVCTIAML